MSAKLFIRDDAGKETEIEGEMVLIFAATGEKMNVVTNELVGDGVLALNATRWLAQTFMDRPGAPKILGNMLAVTFDEWVNIVAMVGDGLTPEEFEERAFELLGAPVQEEPVLQLLQALSDEAGREDLHKTAVYGPVDLELTEPVFEDPRIE